MSHAFQLVRPKSIEEAMRVLWEHEIGEAKIIAGGTDVVPNLQMRLFAPKVVVDIKGIAAMRGIEFRRDTGLRIGANTTLTEIVNSALVREQFPVLWHAVGTIAGPLQRNMGTIGGNLCLETRCLWYNQSYFWRKALGGCLKHPMPNRHAAHPETLCHVAPGGKRCWAVWSGDSAPAFLALDAELEVFGAAGIYWRPLSTFYSNNGLDRIDLSQEEIVVAVRVPHAMAGRRGTYHKLRIRNSIDYPLAGVAVSMDVDKNGVCRDARVAVNAVNPAPLLLAEAAASLVGQKHSPELVEQVTQAAIRTGKPLTTSASTPVYRRTMLKVLTRRALEEAWRNGSSK